ncbi:MAG: protein-L-isoaspartate(D-aspartate) O-methyltransferase [Candidatus Omnitrophota bacterium]
MIKMKQKINLFTFVAAFFLAINLILLLRFSFAEEIDQYFKQRRVMVDQQIKARGIKDPGVLKAMLKVERHLFLPLAYRRFAYVDSALPIGEDQTISQPYIVALMTEALMLKDTDKVLEIGTGSGYQAAILAEIAKEVYTIEIIPKLAKTAGWRLKESGYENIHVKCGDGYLGWPEESPFDAIIVTCSVDEIPEPLIEQLAEGGRLVIPLGGYGYQKLSLIEKKDNKIEKSFISGCVFVPMTGEHVK